MWRTVKQTNMKVAKATDDNVRAKAKKHQFQYVSIVFTYVYIPIVWSCMIMVSHTCQVSWLKFKNSESLTRFPIGQDMQIYVRISESYFFGLDMTTSIATGHLSAQSLQSFAAPRPADLPDLCGVWAGEDRMEHPNPRQCYTLAWLIIITSL